MGGNIREQEEPKYAFIILLLFIKWRRVLSKFSEMLMLNYVKLKRRELYTFVSSVCDTGSNQLNEKLPNLKVVCLREREREERTWTERTIHVFVLKVSYQYAGENEKKGTENGDHKQFRRKSLVKQNTRLYLG